MADKYQMLSSPLLWRDLEGFVDANKFRMISDWLLDVPQDIQLTGDIAQTSSELSKLNAQEIILIKIDIDGIEQDIVIIENHIIAIYEELDDHDARITTNKNNIQTNTTNIAVVKVTADANQLAISQANGELVGHGDFCTLSDSGVVLLAANVAQLTGALADAPAEYNQAYFQQMKDRQDALQNKVNDLILGQINGQQMAQPLP